MQKNHLQSRLIAGCLEKQTYIHLLCEWLFCVAWLGKDRSDSLITPARAELVNVAPIFATCLAFKGNHDVDRC